MRNSIANSTATVLGWVVAVLRHECGLRRPAHTRTPSRREPPEREPPVRDPQRDHPGRFQSESHGLHGHQLSSGASFDISINTGNATDLSRAVLDSTDLTGATFVGADVGRATFVGATAIATDWSDADLSRADFSNADMTLAVFNATTNLRDTDFQNAILIGATFDDVDLSRRLTPRPLSRDRQPDRCDLHEPHHPRRPGSTRPAAGMVLP